MMKSKVVILGSSGFLGSCLYENFSRAGHYEVCGFSRAQLDLTSEESALKLYNLVGQDAVIIMAASSLAKDKSYHSFHREVAMFNNIANPELLCRVRHFILVSSTVIYGHCSDALITESSSVNPYDIYSTAKLIGELIFKRACADCGVGLTILRPGILYGRGDYKSPLFRFVHDVYSGRAIESHGDDSTRLVWLHKLDAWRAVRLIVDGFKTGDYNIISDGNGISLEELAELVFKTCCVRTGIKLVSGTKVSSSLKFDLSKFKANFPGFEFTELEEGIKDYLDENKVVDCDQI
jgi:nucleoside-diphosphate-sugar epimerase